MERVEMGKWMLAILVVRLYLFSLLGLVIKIQ